MPPTRTTSLTSLASSLASFNAFLTASKELSINSWTIDSSLARDILMSKCFGPSAPAVIKGIEISVS